MNLQKHCLVGHSRFTFITVLMLSLALFHYSITFSFKLG